MEKSNTTVVSVAQEARPALTVSYELLPQSDEIIANNPTYEPTLRYDADAIRQYYRRRPFQVWGRYINTFLPLLTFAFKMWWDKRTQQTERNAKKRAIQLREMLTGFGPAYIKMGQALSTRPDLMSATFLEELTLLQDQLPPFSNEIAFRLIETELGSPPEKIYAELTPNPIAAASLGQVYKGRLYSGEEVALKVQRPGLRERIELDVYILRNLAAWAKQNFKFIRSDLVAILDEFATRLFEEMDYIQEGKHAERFERLYGSIPEIYVPKIYWQYTSRRVLTMEWINGVKLTNVPEVRRRGIDATHMINVGVQCSLRQLLEHGFFHADPHPGNLLATDDGKLAYLDFGMMSEVKPPQRYGLIEAIVHMVNRDFEGLAQDYVKLDFLTPETDITPIVPALAHVFENALGASVAELNFKSITDRMSDLMYEYPFRVPAYYALIIRCLVTLEGIAIGIDPNFKVLSKAYPYIAKRLLTDPAPELRSSLQELLFKDGSFRWNRLENLLRNARGSAEYDLTEVLDRTTEFLFSERGAFIRENLVDEIVKNIDDLGQRTLNNVSDAIRQRVGLPNSTAAKAAPNSATLDHIKRIWDILQETRGFDPMKLLPIIPQLLVKPETQKMGQAIASRLAQRVATRLIREVLLQDTSPAIPQNDSPPSLPPAR
jgi:predicted unusual protein kinase regulating ubiquinone biosynthesis (AarF/ABC1/UbiB family)